MYSDLFRYSPPRQGDDDSDDSNDLSDEDEEDDSDDNRHHGMGAASSSTSAQRKSAEFTEMKEQMYQDKLSDLKRQLAKLNEGSLPEWQKKLRKQDSMYRERLRINDIIRDLEIEMVEREFIREKKSAVTEFEEQKVFLRDQLISELEEKQRMIETERHNMELTGDSMELKPITTRKLRRRANEPSGSGNYGPGEKRRKPMQMSSMTYLLEDTEVLDDLKIINKNKAFSMHKASSQSSNSSAGGSSPNTYHRDIRIEEGKLFYEKRWFRRGQSIQVEPKNGDKFPATISAITPEAIWVRKLTDSTKSRIYLTQLTKGKFVLKRRAV